MKYSNLELDYLQQALFNNQNFIKKCERLLSAKHNNIHVLMTSSCTAALEIMAMLTLSPGDEVIMPSWTFASSANVVARQGAIPVFVDIRPDTLNIDERLIEAAITSKTRAIMPVHYAGNMCNMQEIVRLAIKHGLYVLEDAAQAIGCYGELGYPGEFDMAAMSFHSTKNISCGEGGAFLTSHDDWYEKAITIRDKGTNHQSFKNKEINQYGWTRIGAAGALSSEFQAAVLYGQLQRRNEIEAQRFELWNTYAKILGNKSLNGCHNAHIYWALVKNRDSIFLEDMVSHLGLKAVMLGHYQPLHLSEAGKKYGRIHGELSITERINGSLIRLPLTSNITVNDAKNIAWRVAPWVI